MDEKRSSSYTFVWVLIIGLVLIGVVIDSCEGPSSTSSSKPSYVPKTDSEREKELYDFRKARSEAEQDWEIYKEINYIK
jgi:hypothetical protein